MPGGSGSRDGVRKDVRGQFCNNRYFNKNKEGSIDGHRAKTFSHGKPDIRPKPELKISKRKIYILDTSVLLHDPRILDNLENNHIVIPISVLNKLEEFNKGMDELSTNSRQILKYLRDITRDNNIVAGIGLKNGGKLFINTEDDLRGFAPIKTHKDTLDTRILAVALKLQKDNPLSSVIVITNSPGLLNKAAAYGVKAEEYKSDQVGEIYTGVQEINDFTGALSDSIRKYGEAPRPATDIEMLPNEIVVIKNNKGSTIETINKNNRLIPTRIKNDSTIFGIKPKNQEQRSALELLMDPDIALVTMVGPAGTGKTLLALAAALEQLKNKTYRRISVARPIIPMGEEMGFFPGTVQEKTRPWLMPIFDNLDFLFRDKMDSPVSINTPESKKWKNETARERNKKDKRKNKISADQQGVRENKKVVSQWEKLVEAGCLDLVALPLLRGRTMPHQFIIIDEAQNITGLEIKTIITRAGVGTKIVLIGDIDQIDNRYLNKNNNGLSIAIHRCKNSDITGNIMLTSTVRSELAKLGATLL